MRLLFIIIFSLFATSCERAAQSTESAKESDLYYGVIKPMGMTTWQYGTHLLSGYKPDEREGSEAEPIMFAMKSDGKVDLDAYSGQRVVIRANPVSGYPVDGGPVFLEVNNIKADLK